MLGLKNYLLPQLESQNVATQIIAHFPTIFLLSIFSIGVLLICTTFYARRLSQIDLYSRISRIPLVGNYVRLYLTAYYAREWGNLIGQGIELMAIVGIMQKQKSLLFQEIGKDMEEALLSGQAFHQKVLDYPFFLRELSLMIEYGEIKSKLGRELDIYAEETWQSFFGKLTQATQLIQPLVFVFVALIIVLIYVAMLLPMYQNMGGNFLMKKIWKKLRKKSVAAFTLVEMLIVLLIISVLMLLFVPNLSKQKDVVREKGDAAVVKVVESQMDLYELKTGDKPTVDDLVEVGYITSEQAKTYNEAKK